MASHLQSALKWQGAEEATARLAAKRRVLRYTYNVFAPLLSPARAEFGGATRAAVGRASLLWRSVEDKYLRQEGVNNMAGGMPQVLEQLQTMQQTQLAVQQQLQAVQHTQLAMQDALSRIELLCVSISSSLFLSDLIVVASQALQHADPSAAICDL